MEYGKTVQVIMTYISRLIIVCLAAGIGYLENCGYPADRGRRPSSQDSSFHFVRLRYGSGDTTMYPDMLFSKAWFTDFDDSSGRTMDNYLRTGLRQWTTIDAGDNIQPGPAQEIFNYPFIYTVEPEQMTLSPLERARIREWLYRGGIWMMDDFHGCPERDHVISNIRKIVNNAEFESLKTQHPIFHTVYDLNKIVQVPVVDIGQRWATDHSAPTWEGPLPCIKPEVLLWDGGPHDGKILLVWNSDLGDGLEYADDPAYPVRFSAYSYKFFVNAIVWALSH